MASCRRRATTTVSAIAAVRIASVRVPFGIECLPTVCWHGIRLVAPRRPRSPGECARRPALTAVWLAGWPSLSPSGAQVCAAFSSRMPKRGPQSLGLTDRQRRASRARTSWPRPSLCWPARRRRAGRRRACPAAPCAAPTIRSSPASSGVCASAPEAEGRRIRAASRLARAWATDRHRRAPVRAERSSRPRRPRTRARRPAPPGPPALVGLVVATVEQPRADGPPSALGVSRHRSAVARTTARRKPGHCAPLGRRQLVCAAGTGGAAGRVANSARTIRRERTSRRRW